MGHSTEPPASCSGNWVSLHGGENLASTWEKVAEPTGWKLKLKQTRLMENISKQKRKQQKRNVQWLLKNPIYKSHLAVSITLKPQVPMSLGFWKLEMEAQGTERASMQSQRVAPFPDREEKMNILTRTSKNFCCSQLLKTFVFSPPHENCFTVLSKKIFMLRE